MNNQKSFRVKFEVKFNDKSVKSFSTTVPAEDQNEAFEKANNYIENKLDSNILDIKEVAPKRKESISNKDKFFEDLDKFGSLIDDNRSFDEMEEKEIDSLVEISKDIHDFFKFVKRFR